MKLLNIKQVAAMLSVCKRTAEYWQASGRLPGFVKLYGNRRWRSDVIEDWMAAGCPELALCRSMQTEIQTSTIESESGESRT
jgi:predicted DNA-binding transcriptional regulator AlpA